MCVCYWQRNCNQEAALTFSQPFDRSVCTHSFGRTCCKPSQLICVHIQTHIHAIYWYSCFRAKSLTGGDAFRFFYIFNVWCYLSPEMLGIEQNENCLSNPFWMRLTASAVGHITTATKTNTLVFGHIDFYLRKWQTVCLSVFVSRCDHLLRYSTRKYWPCVVNENI